MTINCYQCKTKPLTPTKLDFGLPSLQCTDCRGTHIDLLTYRSWLEDVSDDIEEQKQAEQTEFCESELSNTDRAMICQRCQKFMRKYNINNDYDNTINVCQTCDDVWLDSGEWELLKYLKIQDKLTDVMGDPWQNELRTKEQEQAFNQHYKNVLGDDFAKVDEFVTWLISHPNKAQIKHFLLTKDE